MKKSLLIVVFVFFLTGCNMNPNKEERIQKLETEIQETLESVKELENKVKTLEELYQELKQK